MINTRPIEELVDKTAIIGIGGWSATYATLSSSKQLKYHKNIKSMKSIVQFIDLAALHVRNRELIQKRLQKKGFHCQVPLHLPVFANLNKPAGRFPVPGSTAGRVLVLPTHPHELIVITDAVKGACS